MARMNRWITTGERELPAFVMPFAKSASGGRSSKDDEDDDDSDDDDDDDDEDDDDEDDLADLSEDELRAELKKTRESLSKASGSSKSKRDRIKRLNRELEEARKPKPKSKSKDDDDDSPDLDTVRHEARAEGEKAGTLRAKKAEARAALISAGVDSSRVARLVGMIDLDDLDLDDDGLDGIEEAIEDLRREVPELFAKKRRRRESTAGESDRSGDKGERRGSDRKTKTASQIAADRILGRAS